jgi:hypothetical protein
MPSNKKARGKERKAKKELAKQEQRLNEEQALRARNCICCHAHQYGPVKMGVHNPCLHGHNHVNETHEDFVICNNFIHVLETQKPDTNSIAFVHSHYLAHNKEIGDNPIRKQLVKQMMLAFAVDALLFTLPGIDRPSNGATMRNDPTVFHLIIAILMIEHYDTEKSDLDNVTRITMKMQDALGDVSKVIHFLRKRVPCGCLNELRKKFYMDVNTKNHSVFCKTCDKGMRKGEVKLCPVCRMSQYCSQSCVDKDWSSHQEFCRTYTAFKLKADGT